MAFTQYFDIMPLDVAPRIKDAGQYGCAGSLTRSYSDPYSYSSQRDWQGPPNVDDNQLEHDG